MKKCPYCAEEIQDEAIVCKHCGRDLSFVPQRPRQVTPQPPVRVDPKEKNKQNRNTFVIVILVGAFVLVCCTLTYWLFSYSAKAANITAPVTAGGHTVTYLIEGDVPMASVTYFNSNGSMEQKEVPLPFKYEFQSTTNPMLSLVAQSKSGSGNISCKILIDGQVKKQANSSGAYVVVTCADVVF